MLFTLWVACLEALEADEGEAPEHVEAKDDEEMDDSEPPPAEPQEDEQQPAATAAASSAESVAPPEPELPPPVPDVGQEVPSGNTEQLSKWVALALVYGTPTPKQLALGVASASAAGAASSSSSTARWTNKLFQSQRVPSVCSCPGHPLTYHTRCFWPFLGPRGFFFLALFVGCIITFKIPKKKGQEYPKMKN